MGEKRILLVEDETDIREILSLALQGEGYAVDAVATVADGKSRLASVQYALVIADWRLPDGDGLVIADWAKELGSKTLIMSGYLFAMPGGRAIDHETLMKPMRPSELVKIVEQNIGKVG